MNRLRRLRDATPGDPAVWLLMGNVWAHGGQLSYAEECFSTSAALLPANYLAYFNRGRCRLEQSRYQDALQDFEQVVALRPDLVSGWLNQAIALRALGELSAANQRLSLVIGMPDVPSRAYFLRADIRRVLGDREGAHEDFHTGLRLTPGDAESWTARGIAKVSEDPRGALADFDRALELNPRSRRAAQNALYVLIEKLDDSPAALARLDGMICRDPVDRLALSTRCVLLARLGRFEDSLRDVTALLANSPTPKQVYQAGSALALHAHENGQVTSRAIDLIAEAFRQDPALTKIADADPDLAFIRDNEGYRQVRDAARVIGGRRKGAHP